jgi:hypothetical protein
VGSWNLGEMEWSRRIPARSAGRASVSRGGRRESGEDAGVWVGFYSDGALSGGGREGKQAHGRLQDNGQRRRARRGCVAAARDRRPDVAERGTASGGSTGGGRSGGATRGVG